MPVFEAALLPDASKEQLCRSLLDEFGATSVNQRDDELIHGCLLPFGNHKDQARNPTASLNWKKLTYKCLGCGSGGGLLWFIASCRGGSASDARKWLDGAAGLGNTVQSLSDLLRYFDALYAGPARTVDPIPTYSERVLKPWEWFHPYLTEVRGVPEQTVLDMRVGYAMAYETSPGNFSERIVIPHFWEGRLVGWQTRRLADDGTPKYLSSPAFPKDQTLYDHDPSREVAVVVESPFSVLRHRHHQPMVATFGASITESQIRLLQKYRKVVLFLDNDQAGWDAMFDLLDNKGRVQRVGLINALVPYCKVYVVANPYSADPADLPDDVVDDLIANAVPWPVFEVPKSLLAWEGVST